MGGAGGAGGAVDPESAGALESTTHGAPQGNHSLWQNNNNKRSIHGDNFYTTVRSGHTHTWGAPTG